ncbi:BTBD2-like protein [Mya arenaria]|uniref:BTBD2-like protein n=1 Tax=Mya arenaria TaxID=6604 RepID=A0ABY7G0J3_MYAAR|nr:BTB/POZ domain-containing protein 2-like [Mya arenaria]WAR27978.1 BTBD2-like protein [Mya arenaria]
MSDNWQHEESFPVTNEHMLDNDVLSDVTILAGEDKQEVRCHRFMLASRSPVFYKMFCGSLPEAGVVEIPDFDAAVLKMMVRFMYTGEIELMPDSVTAVMYAANKYDILPLSKRCKTFLKKNIDVETVCIILEQALKIEENDLIQQCLSFISENTVRVFQTDDFLRISPEARRLVLEKERQTQQLPPEEVYASCKIAPKPFFVERFAEVKPGWTHSNSLEGIGFKTSKEVSLSSVALYLPYKPGSLTGPLEILEEQTFVLTQNVTLSYKKNEKYEHIPLGNNVKIRPQVTYTVRQRLEGQPSFYGENDKGKQSFDDVEIEFVKLSPDQFDNNGTTVESGQIHGLTFEG